MAVIGDPVAHSASPALHRAFIAAAGLRGSYEAIRVRAGQAAEAIDDLRARGYAGLNVTTPLKEEALARAETHDTVSRASRAVNVLLLGPRIEGHNTDGVGALAALSDAGLPKIAGAHVLVLGAGPTARATVAALTAAQAAVFLWNRTGERAERIARELGGEPWHAGLRVDAVFSALPPGVRFGEAAMRATLRESPVVVDANYGVRANLGAALGRSDVRDGNAMLQASARASFALFRTLA